MKHVMARVAYEDHSCGVCIALWREYAQANREHINALKAAECGIVSGLHGAAARLENAASNVRAHLAEAHDEKPRVMTAGGHSG